MNNVQNVLKVNPYQIYSTQPQQASNVVSFRADKNDVYQRKSYAIDPQRDAMEAALKKQEKEQKKQKTKNNILTGITTAAMIAIIISCIPALRAMFGKGTGIGEFKLSNLEFKNLAKDEGIFDIRTSKSLHPRVKQFFTDLMDKGEIPENIAKRAGILGEGGTNSVLLLGGSGVGKTEVIKAYAKATDADYVAIKLSDFANSFINGTSKNITEMINALIKRAKENPNKQLVISLDEVDALVKISSHDTSGEISKNRQSLLTGIDELLELPNIKLFTSSNAKVESLDGAFLRRCGYNFTVPMPNKEQLLEATKFQMRKCEGAFDNEGVFFNNNKELDKFMETLVSRKCAFGDVKNICKAAKDQYALDMHKSNDANKKFSVKYLEDALNKIETTAGEKAAKEGSFV